MVDEPTTSPATQDARAILAKLWPYFRPFRLRLVVVGVIAVVGTLVELLAPYLLGVAVDAFISGTAAKSYPWLQALTGPQPDRWAGLSTVMMLLAISYALSWGLNVAQFQAMVYVAQHVLLKLRADILAKLHRLSLAFYDQHEAGDLMSRLTNDTQTISDVFGVGITRLIRMLLSMVGIVVAMIALNWRLALASYTMLPLILRATLFFTRRVRLAYREARRTIGAVSAELQENIAAVREVQAFAREEEIIRDFGAVNARNRDANVHAETISAIYSPTLDVLSIIALAIVVGYGGYLYLHEPPLVTIGTIVAFSTYVPRFYDPIRELAMMFAQMQAAIAGSERIFDLLEQEPAVMDRPDATPLGPVVGRVVYEHVSFHYVPEEPVLSDVSVTIEPGQTVALVGPTGAGKSTFANLLLRFYDPQEGCISIDGHDLRDVTQASLRAQIGIVLQDTFLFAGTVMENIRYGRLEATDDEVIAAAQTANAHDFIL
ncbi:MAG: ABC transporter ATP-binding protein, partial [Anaerolineales bacterium]